MRCRLILICLLLFTSISWAASLQWNASVVDEQHSAPTGYRIHRGTAPGAYDWQIDVGLALQWPIPDDLYGEYYWSASAYNASGSSGYSNEVFWQRAPPQYPGATNLLASKLQQQTEQQMAVVQYADAYSSSVAFPGTVTAGNIVIIVAMGSAAFSSPAMTAGTATIGSFSNVTGRNSTYGYIQMFYAAVTGSGTLTLGYSSGVDNGITILEVSGLDVSTGVEAENYTTTPTQNPSVTLTAAAGSLLVAALIDEGASSGTVTAGSAPAAWTLIGNQSAHQHAVQILVLASGISSSACTLNTTGTPTNTYSVYQVVSFKASGGGTSAVKGGRGNLGIMRGMSRLMWIENDFLKPIGGQ